MGWRRLLLHKQDTVITGINKLSLAVGAADSLRPSAMNCPLDLIFDGEGID